MKTIDIQRRFFNVRLEAKALDANFEWAMERRRTYLADVIKSIRESMTNLLAANLAGASELERVLIKGCLTSSSKIIDKLELQSKVFKAENKNGITDEMIQKAKDYPITILLPDTVHKNFTRCISHEDRHPSMGIKNNRVRCFVCGFGGDSIDVYQLLNNANFRQAVIFLNEN